MFEKLKSFLEDETVYFATLLVLVCIASFLLGRNSVTVASSDAKKQDITFLEPAADESILVRQTVVASKNGSKYHYLDCPGADSIKEENKIIFESTNLAEAAGYVLAANCK